MIVNRNTIYMLANSKFLTISEIRPDITKFFSWNNRIFSKKKNACHCYRLFNKLRSKLQKYIPKFWGFLKTKNPHNLLGQLQNNVTQNRIDREISQYKELHGVVNSGIFRPGFFIWFIRRHSSAPIYDNVNLSDLCRLSTYSRV